MHHCKCIPDAILQPLLHTLKAMLANGKASIPGCTVCPVLHEKKKDDVHVMVNANGQQSAT